MQVFKHFFNISIDNEEKRKTFLVNFFSIAALLSLFIFATIGLIEGKLIYSLQIITFWVITLLNLIFFKVHKNFNISGHIVIILMLIFGIVVFSFLGVGISGLFWFYTFPALTITLTNYKTGSLYSAIFILIIALIYKLNFSFVSNVYPDEIKFRFIISYFILNILIIIFEYSREKTQNKLLNTFDKLKDLNKELNKKNNELKSLKGNLENQNIVLNSTLSKYNLISNSINDLIWMLSFDMKPLYISPSCKKFIGYNVEELKAKGLQGFHTGKSLNIIKKLIEDTKELRNKKKEAKGIKTEIEYIHKNGSIIIAEVSAFLLFDDNNNAIAIGGISRDVSKRKKTELALKKSNKKIALAHKDILDNIKYAKTIQNGLLTKKDFIDNLFKDYFLIFKQRFAVGGDFYYINKINDYIIFAVGDCTGHGVPGGLLTMIAITYLHETIRDDKIQTTRLTLDILRNRFKKIFGDENNSGFNISLCAINTKTNILQYSGAYHPLILIRDNELIEYKGTRNPIGNHFLETNFKSQEISLNKNDKIYLFSDGYYDQINAEGKKIGKKILKELLLKYSNLPFNKQKEKLEQHLYNWKRNEIQIDDITILGLNWEN